MGVLKRRALLCGVCFGAPYFGRLKHDPYLAWELWESLQVGCYLLPSARVKLHIRGLHRGYIASLLKCYSATRLYTRIFDRSSCKFHRSLRVQST